MCLENQCVEVEKTYGAGEEKRSFFTGKQRDAPPPSLIVAPVVSVHQCPLKWWSPLQPRSTCTTPRKDISLHQISAEVTAVLSSLVISGSVAPELRVVQGKLRSLCRLGQKGTEES